MRLIESKRKIEKLLLREEANLFDWLEEDFSTTERKGAEPALGSGIFFDVIPTTE